MKVTNSISYIIFTVGIVMVFGLSSLYLLQESYGLLSTYTTGNMRVIELSLLGWVILCIGITLIIFAVIINKKEISKRL